MNTKTKSITLFATIAAFALAGCNEQVGRYQLHSGMYEPLNYGSKDSSGNYTGPTYRTVFLVDTATGRAWYAAPGTGPEQAPIFLPTIVRDR